MISVVIHAGPGQDDYSLQLANALSEFARVGYSIDDRQLARYGEALSKNVTPLVFHRPRLRDLRGFGEMARLAQAIRTFKPDIFHLQADGIWESVLLRMIGNIPLVNTVHDPIKHIDQRNRLNISIQADTIKRACGWVVHSEGLKRIFLERFPVDANRILTHPHGVSNYYLRFMSYNLQREKNLLFFGKLRVNKGCDILLKAFEIAKGELDGWTVIVAGQGEGLDNEQALVARLGARLDLRLRRIPDIEVGDLFSRVGIVVLPYLHTSHSGVLCIAAAFACPVIATRVGNIPEILQDGKHVVLTSPGDAKSLAEGIVKLACNPRLMSKIGGNLKQLAEADWSWMKIANKTAMFYEQILKGRDS